MELYITMREFERRMLLRRVVRSYSSASNRRFSAVTAAKSAPADTSPASNKDGVSTRENLGSRLLTLVNTKLSADFVLRKWKFEGRPIVPFELNLAVRELRKLKRYQHALEICEWRTKQRDAKLHSGDYALHLDLVAKIYGIEKAERFFKAIPAPMLDHSTHSALLHSYVQNNLQDKAEALMAEMLESGLVKNPLPYNHMLSLYMANGQLEKVPELIEELKKTTSPNVVTYNMWLTYCVRQNDVETAERVFSELKDSKRDPDWLTHSAMANLYTKNGLGKKAMEALIEVEKLASRRNRGTYSSLLSLRTNIGDKEGVRGVWNKMKVMFPKRSDDEYKCMMSSLLKLGELKEAEEIYSEWETESGSKDSRVSNILLAAYINGGKMGKAEEFFERMTKSRIKRSYTTLELLTWGFTKQRDAEKALLYFEAAVKSVAKWQPEEKLVSELLTLVEEGGNVEGAEKMLEVLRVAFYVTTEIYNSVLRTYAKAGKWPLLVEERMKEDRVRMDKETREMIKTARKTCKQ